MTETVQLAHRASGTWILGCTVNLYERGIYTPLARPDVAGLALWCRSCKSEHVMAWLALLMVMERFVGEDAFRQVLMMTLGAVPPTGRKGEDDAK